MSAPSAAKKSGGRVVLGLVALSEVELESLLGQLSGSAGRVDVATGVHDVDALDRLWTLSEDGRVGAGCAGEDGKRDVEARRPL